MDKSFILIGSFSVDAGMAMIGDPCYLKDWNDNIDDEWDTDSHKGKYNYQGSAEASLNPPRGGTLGNGMAVAFSTGYGDGEYSVYAKYNNDNVITQILVNFEEDEDD